MGQPLAGRTVWHNFFIAIYYLDYLDYLDYLGYLDYLDGHGGQSA